MWAVYLWFGQPSDSTYASTKAAWTKTGLPISGGDCDSGSIAAGVPEGATTIAVYFKTKADAEAFSQGVSPKPMAMGEVKTMCMD